MGRSSRQTAWLPAAAVRKARSTRAPPPPHPVHHEVRAARAQLVDFDRARAAREVHERAREHAGPARARGGVDERERVVARGAGDEAALERGRRQRQQLVDGAARLEAARRLCRRRRGRGAALCVRALRPAAALRTRMAARPQRQQCRRTCSDSSLRYAAHAPAALSQGEGSSGVRRTCGRRRAAAAALAAARSAMSWAADAPLMVLAAGVLQKGAGVLPKGAQPGRAGPARVRSGKHAVPGGCVGMGARAVATHGKRRVWELPAGAWRHHRRCACQHRLRGRKKHRRVLESVQTTFTS